MICDFRLCFVLNMVFEFHSSIDRYFPCVLNFEKKKDAVVEMLMDFLLCTFFMIVIAFFLCSVAQYSVTIFFMLHSVESTWDATSQSLFEQTI